MRIKSPAQESVSQVTQWLPVNSTFHELLMTMTEPDAPNTHKHTQAQHNAPFSTIPGAHFAQTEPFKLPHLKGR